MAGALSMGAGAFVASSSESEVRDTELARKRFLGEAVDPGDRSESPLASASFVGTSHLAGALVPMLPIVLGAHSALPSVIGAGAVNGDGGWPELPTSPRSDWHPTRFALWALLESQGYGNGAPMIPRAPGSIAGLTRSAEGRDRAAR